MSGATTIFYKRATFVTQLPIAHVYLPSHGWLSEVTPGRWRVGYTKFALRMLGDLVDVQFERQPGSSVAAGDIVGSIEGFKAVSDLYCAGQGRFRGGNPALSEDLEWVARDPYSAGWLYEFDGVPDGRALSVHAYRDLLDTTIDRILAQQKADDKP